MSVSERLPVTPVMILEAKQRLEGIVVRIKGRTRVVINVDIIRQSFAVEVDSALLVAS